MSGTGSPPALVCTNRTGFRQRLAEIGAALVSVFFPAGCRICDRLLTRAKRVPICDVCLDTFEAPPHTQCRVCGRPLPGFDRAEAETRICPACGQKAYAFECARSFGIYQGALARAILMLKFEEIEPLGEWFARRAGHAG
jgi:predicted amidophosphoribosyltransferase